MQFDNPPQKFSNSTRNRFFLVLHVAISFFPLLANASILNNISDEEMTNDANEIQVGEVVSSWTSPDPDLKMFVTFYKIKVEQTIKGQHVKELLLRQPGGTWKNPDTQKVTRQKVFGMESLQVGERAVLFIKHTKGGAPMMMYQGGKRQIVKDKNTGIDMTVRPTNSRDVEFADDHSEPGTYAKFDQQPLDQMITKIQNAMSNPKR